MKIYDFKLAPNPRRVRIFLAEKGLKVPLEEIDIMKGVNRQEQFLRINPLGGIPVLELDDGRYLAESVAICRYFEELHPEPALFGTGAFERATIEMWNRRMEFAVFAPVGMVWAHLHELTRTRVKQIPELGEQQKKIVEARYRWLDEEFGQRKFLAGDKFSIADITALVAVDFAKFNNIAIAPEHKHLQRWHQEVSARPSAQA
ncbi:MAG TPA: glutathione S-transferase family protein [Candidatus Binataceae bacterium]|nr:glutathione S-transferase family protein [Candidatus Binataceae bacterium]